jgi:hypothetical protein
MDRWIKRLSGESPGANAYRDWLAEYDTELKAARAATPALPKVEVEPFSRKPKCPKCGKRGIGTEYHEGVHPDCPHLYMSDPKHPYEMQIYGQPAPRVVVARERQREAAVEHLDRRCWNCLYGWTEATI